MEALMDRRSFLAAAPAVALVPFSASAGAASPLGGLIEAHRMASTLLDATYDRLGEIEMRCRCEPERVQYSRMAFTHEPLHAWSIEELDAISHQNMTIRRALGEDAAATEAKRVAWLSDKASELTAIKAANEAERRRHGFYDADAAVHRAQEAELQARVALVLYRPATGAEADERQRYTESAHMFHATELMDDRFVAALLRALGVHVASG
jgi:hypothetical protein